MNKRASSIVVEEVAERWQARGDEAYRRAPQEPDAEVEAHWANVVSYVVHQKANERTLRGIGAIGKADEIRAAVLALKSKLINAYQQWRAWATDNALPVGLDAR